MSKIVLTPAAAMEIKRLYALEDSKGNKIYSQMAIAEMLGVSETTVFRAVHKRGAYMGVRELPSDAETAASQARFMAANPQLFEKDTALARMQAAATESRELPKKVDSMLEALSAEAQKKVELYLGKPPTNPMEEA